MDVPAVLEVSGLTLDDAEFTAYAAICFTVISLPWFAPALGSVSVCVPVVLKTMVNAD